MIPKLLWLMVLTFDIDTLLISIFDNIFSNQEICHFVPLWPYISKKLYFWSSWLLTYLRVISDMFRQKWLSLKIRLSVGRHFCFYANFCNFCPNFVIHWSMFLMLVSKCSEKLWLYCQMSSNSTLIKTYSPACQKEKNTIFHKVHLPHSGCHSNQTMLLSYTKWPGFDAVIFYLLETIYFCKVIGTLSG